jgi:hypothetical protein
MVGNGLIDRSDQLGLVESPGIVQPPPPLDDGTTEIECIYFCSITGETAYDCIYGNCNIHRGNSGYIPTAFGTYLNTYALAVNHCPPRNFNAGSGVAVAGFCEGPCPSFIIVFGPSVRVRIN